MPVNFTDSPSNGDTVTSGGFTYTYDSTNARWKSSAGTSFNTEEVQDVAGAMFTGNTETGITATYQDSDGTVDLVVPEATGIAVYATMALLIAATGMSTGDLAYVTANNKLYLYSVNGWFLVATVANNSPTAITGVAATTSLATDATATVITAVSTDPEGFPLTWSYAVTTGSLTNGGGATATVSQNENVFTITPTTTEAYAGTFSITFTVTDGTSGAVNAVSAFTLDFYAWLHPDWSGTRNVYSNTSSAWPFTESGTNTTYYHAGNLGTLSLTDETYTVNSNLHGTNPLKIHFEMTTHASQPYYNAGFISTSEYQSDNHLHDVNVLSSYPGHYGGQFESNTGKTYSFILDRNTSKIHYWRNGVYDATRSQVMAAGTYYACLGDGSSGNSASSSVQSTVRGINSNGRSTFTYDPDTLWNGYKWSSVYEQATIEASDGAQSDAVGYHVALDGDTGIAGAYSGAAAYIFTRSGTTWSQQQKLEGDDNTDTAAQFGGIVAISGNTVVVGAERDDIGGDRVGQAYVITRSGTTWSLQQKLTHPTDSADAQRFGGAVAIDGDTLAVGMYAADSSAGEVCIYTRSGTTWSHQQTIQASDRASGDYFGYWKGLAIDGDNIIVGAEREDTGGSNAGAAYIFTRSGTTWTEQQKIQASDKAASDNFGNSVAIDGDSVIVGAQAESTGATGAGAAYIFTRSGTTWTQQQKIQASDASSYSSAYFGYSVTIKEDFAAAGAVWRGPSSRGAVYTYTRSGTTWSQSKQVLASDTGDDDSFGGSVSMSGDTLLVGAQGWDNSSGVGTGAVYALVTE